MVEVVDLPMLKKYKFDVKTAFYTPLVCLSLVFWLCKQLAASACKVCMRLAASRIKNFTRVAASLI
jgi:hypothetical protein